MSPLQGDKWLNVCLLCLYLVLEGDLKSFFFSFLKYMPELPITSQSTYTLPEKSNKNEYISWWIRDNIAKIGQNGPKSRPIFCGLYAIAKKYTGLKKLRFRW